VTRVQLEYTVIELGILLRRDPRTVVRWLEGMGVPIRQVGRDRVVWLADLAHHVPEFERSLLLQRDLGRTG
jgi:hypothetical protein